jgi:hypothetical protein
MSFKRILTITVTVMLIFFIAIAVTPAYGQGRLRSSGIRSTSPGIASPRTTRPGTTLRSVGGPNRTHLRSAHVGTTRPGSTSVGLRNFRPGSARPGTTRTGISRFR